MLLDVAHGESHLAHGGETALGLLDELDVPGVLGLAEAANDVLKGLLVRDPLLNQGPGSRSLPGSSLDNGGLDGGLAGRRGSGLGGVLALAALGNLLASDGSGGGSGKTVVVVDTAHVVPKVPLTREAIAVHGAVAAIIGAQERLVSVAVHGMSLALVTEEASSGREAGVLARGVLATVGLQVGVNKLAKDTGISY